MFLKYSHTTVGVKWLCKLVVRANSEMVAWQSEISIAFKDKLILGQQNSLSAYSDLAGAKVEVRTHNYCYAVTQLMTKRMKEILHVS